MRQVHLTCASGAPRCGLRHDLYIYSYPSRFFRSGWALLLVRISEVLPLVCTKSGVDLRIIAFINEVPVIREILGYLGEQTSAPSLAPERGSPLWALPITEQAERETDTAGPTGTKI